MIRDIILKNRSYRRFYEKNLVSYEILQELVDLARCSASSANLQPLKYILSINPEKNAKIFPCLAWAGYLKDWSGPGKGERPSAYIIILGDTEITSNFSYDCGIAAQSILLGAVEKGLGGCMIGSIQKGELCNILGTSDQYEILLVLAIGKPKEKVVIEDIGQDHNIKYWRDKNGIHHVPKRRLNDIILKSTNATVSNHS